MSASDEAMFARCGDSGKRPSADPLRGGRGSASLRSGHLRRSSAEGGSGTVLSVRPSKNSTSSAGIGSLAGSTVSSFASTHAR